MTTKTFDGQYELIGDQPHTRPFEAVQASLHDLNPGDPEIVAGEVLVNTESDAS
jgi:hypothetical protein